MLVRYASLQIFSYKFVAGLLILLMAFFCRAKVLNFDSVQRINFFLLRIVFVVSTLRTLQETLDPEDFLLFSSKGLEFIVLHFTLKSTVYFE